MIRCKIHHLDERARQRGKTLADVEACIVERDGDEITVDTDHDAYPKATSQPPAMISRAKNFAVAATQHVAAGRPRASDEEIERRWNICQPCEHFNGSVCVKCGCGISRDAKILSKLAWADSKCPVDKWQRVDT